MESFQTSADALIGRFRRVQRTHASRAAWRDQVVQLLAEVRASAGSASGDGADGPQTIFPCTGGGGVLDLTLLCDQLRQDNADRALLATDPLRCSTAFGADRRARGLLCFASGWRADAVRVEALPDAVEVTSRVGAIPVGEDLAQWIEVGAQQVVLSDLAAAHGVTPARLVWLNRHLRLGQPLRASSKLAPGTPVRLSVDGALFGQELPRHCFQFVDTGLPCAVLCPPTREELTSMKAKVVGRVKRFVRGRPGSRQLDTSGLTDLEKWAASAWSVARLREAARRAGLLLPAAARGVADAAVAELTVAVADLTLRVPDQWRTQDWLSATHAKAMEADARHLFTAMSASPVRRVVDLDQPQRSAVDATPAAVARARAAAKMALRVLHSAPRTVVDALDRLEAAGRISPEAAYVAGVVAEARLAAAMEFADAWLPPSYKTTLQDTVGKLQHSSTRRQRSIAASWQRAAQEATPSELLATAEDAMALLAMANECSAAHRAHQEVAFDEASAAARGGEELRVPFALLPASSSDEEADGRPAGRPRDGGVRARSRGCSSLSPRREHRARRAGRSGRRDGNRDTVRSRRLGSTSGGGRTKPRRTGRRGQDRSWRPGSGAGGVEDDSSSDSDSSAGLSATAAGVTRGRSRAGKRQSIEDTAKSLFSDLERLVHYMPSPGGKQAFRMMKYGTCRHPSFLHITKGKDYLYNPHREEYWELPIALEPKGGPETRTQLLKQLMKDQAAMDWDDTDFVGIWVVMRAALEAIYDREQLRAHRVHRTGFSYEDQVRRQMAMSLALAALIHFRAVAPEDGQAPEEVQDLRVNEAARIRLAQTLLDEAQELASRAVRRHRVCAGQFLRHASAMPRFLPLKDEPSGCKDAQLLAAAPARADTAARASPARTKRRPAAAGAGAAGEKAAVPAAAGNSQSSDRGGGRGSQLRCWNCQQAGHIQRHCPRVNASAKGGQQQRNPSS